jgi:SOS-response transcriptional repressor LexA
MHIIQKQLLDLIATHEDFGSYSLRKIAEMVGAEGKPQTAKYHLQKLAEGGLIQMNLEAGVIKLVKRGYAKASTSPIYSLPVVGSANCGPATIFAEQNIDQYLKISSSLLPRNKSNLYALIADGDSMNKAEIDGKTIESGDFVLVDSEYKTYKNTDIVVAVIDGLATIKRYREDRANKMIILEADSTEKYLPIFIHEGDDFQISGKVVGIIKS